MSTTHPIEEGALARLLTDFHDLRKGTEFEVVEYLEPLPESEREPEDIDAPYYYGSNNGGYNNVFVPADAVELVKTAAQMSARTAPSMAEIRDQISGELLGDFDTFETDETDRDGANGVEVYGRTHEGLPFGFRVRVTDVWLTDL